MQLVNIAPNPQLAIIFKNWAADWAKDVQDEKKDTATKFHTVYNIAANIFDKGGDVDMQILTLLFEDCKHKLENAQAMIAKVKGALNEDDPRAGAIIAKITATANDASHVIRYLGQLLKPAS